MATLPIRGGTGPSGVALTAADAATIDGTFGSEEEGVVNNERTRIIEIETILKGLGIIP